MSVQASRSGHETQGSQNSPASSDTKAKWHTWISTCESINPKREHALKTVSWAQAYGSRDITSDIRYRIFMV